MTRKSTLVLAFALISFGLMTQSTYAQRSYIRGQIRNKIEQDQKEKQKERGREELKKVSYENDTRYPDPKNRVEATIEMEMTSYNKKGQAEKPMNTLLVFGKTGECYVMNKGTKDEMWMLFDYNKKANYMVNISQKSATKMPLINMQKMINRAASKNEVNEDNGGKWTKTNETKSIHGYKCQKYIFTDKDGNKMDSWVTKDISINLSDNYILGSRIKDYAVETDKEKVADQNYPRGMMIRNIMYDKKSGNISSQTDLISFKKSSDAKYFDLSKFKVNDILDGF